MKQTQWVSGWKMQLSVNFYNKKRKLTSFAEFSHIFELNSLLLCTILASHMHSAHIYILNMALQFYKWKWKRLVEFRSGEKKVFGPRRIS